MASLQQSLSDPFNPIGMRMRAAYYLRQAHGDGADAAAAAVAVETLCRGLLEKRHGSLMRHEFAYVLGQLRDERACATLEGVLQNGDAGPHAAEDCVMVRHECAEALGAIGASRSVPVLRGVLERNAGTLELAETCRLALGVMEWRAAGGDPETTPAACACMLNPYSSVDPAPPHPTHANLTPAALGDILCDADRPVFERYRAMFSLRNIGGADPVRQLCRALTTDTSSALLRHEVAYVLGQLQHVASVEALEVSLRRTDEHAMVRHESAEALGAIEGRWDEVERILQEFTSDDDVVVRESCLVALDAADYWAGTTVTADAQEENDAEAVSGSSFAQQKADQRRLVNHFNVQD